MVQHNSIDHSGLTGIPTLSYASNSNSVAVANQPGASTLVSRADHVHLGVTSVSHASNTYSGPVILTNSGIVGITSPAAGTFDITASATAGGSTFDGTMDEIASSATPAAGKARIYPKADGRFYSKDDAGNEYGPFSSGSGALVGERKAWDNATTYPLHTDGSEFEYADLTAFDAFWTRRNVGTTDIFNPPGSHTEFRFDAQGDAIWRATTFPTDGWLVCELSETGWSATGASSQDNMLGIAILDSSGNGFGFAPYQGNFYNINVSGYAYNSFGNAVTPSAAVYDRYLNGQHSWLGIERISTTQYRGAFSVDGSAWETRPTANTPTAFTPDRIALIRLFTSGSVQMWRRVHRINIYSTAFP